jgi:hypothetical protein
MRLRREGSLLTADVYAGRVDAATATPLASATTTDAAYTSFSQVNIGGGYQFDTDAVQVIDLSADMSAPLAIASDSLPTAVIGEFYSGQLSAAGGSAPYSWTVIEGSLPDGVVLDRTTGEVAGTPTTAGTFEFTVEATDGDGASASAERVLEVAPSGLVFSDDADDGDLAPWQQLQSGTISWVDDGGNGVLRKSGNNDPHGGWAELTAPVNDFEMVLFSRKIDGAGGAAVRYSLTDTSGNGYGIYLNYGSQGIAIERRDGWVGTRLPNQGTVPGGLALSEWYTLRLRREGQMLTFELFAGRVDPSQATPLYTIAEADDSYTVATQVNINGGYPFDTDEVIIR